MKRLSFAFCFVWYPLISSAQPEANSLLPRVDKRVELLSIVFKLADKNDPFDNLNPAYTKTIRDHFGKYSSHALIRYASAMVDSLRKGGIEFGYWDIPTIAVHLGPPPAFDPLVAFNKTSSEPWDNRGLLSSKLVALLRKFYADADCASFFKSQEKYYTSVHQQYERQGIRMNRKWFDDFFGLKTTENYYAVLALCLRDGAYLRVNYGANKRDTYSIFGCTAFDVNGLPTTFSDPMFPRSMLHEYVHTFTNQLIDGNMKELQSSAEAMLANPAVFKLMENTFYGNWQFLLYESMVRAGSIRYMMDNKEITTDIEKEITLQERAGFFWMRGLVNELGRYAVNRDRYKNLEAFMPELNKYFKKNASRH